MDLDLCIGWDTFTEILNLKILFCNLVSLKSVILVGLLIATICICVNHIVERLSIFHHRWLGSNFMELQLISGQLG